jgi:diguanylate cyclase (GGDEF)-like protein/PAS domain S-box-containing protein
MGKTTRHPVETATGAAAPSVRSARGLLKIDPVLLGYLIGPPTFFLVLVLERFSVIASHPLGVWLGIFLAIPIASVLADTACNRHPTPARHQVRLAIHAAATTCVIYLTGWGPVLIPAYAVSSLANFSRDGSRVWKFSLAWSICGIVVAQVLIAFGLLSCFLSLRNAQAVATTNVFVLFLIVKMASATVARMETAEASLKRNEERFRALVQNTSDATLVVDGDRQITYASPASMTLLGVAPEDLVGRDPLDLVHPDDLARARSHLHETLLDSDISDHVELKMLGAANRIRDVEAIVTDMLDDPAVEGFVVNIRDISDRKATEELLVHQAHHDGLTGLPNRMKLLEYAESHLERCRAKEVDLAVFFVDLDYFKDVNDTLGHETGDEVLRIVGQRLAAALHIGEMIGRIGGDEFIVLAEAHDSAQSVGVTAARLQEALAHPISTMDGVGPQVELTISIGVAHGLPQTASELVREADIALYQAKLAGRDAWVSFMPEMRSSALRRLQLQSELATALDESQFTLRFQPIVDMEQGRMAKVEALVRWEHPTQGTVPPDQFISALEQSGHIVRLGRWVREEACRQASRWWSAGHDVAVSINASAQELEHPGFVGEVLDAITRHRLPPEALIVEITENGLLQSKGAAVETLAALKQSGVRVAIDDFGTGYSSLAYLLEFDVDALKIDKSFVTAIDTSAHAKAVVRAVLQLGRTLDLAVIAEGIEESEQLALLRSEGCRFGQGHLFSRPVMASTITAMLDRERAAGTGVSDHVHNPHLV